MRSAAAQNPSPRVKNRGNIFEIFELSPAERCAGESALRSAPKISCVFDHRNGTASLGRDRQKNQPDPFPRLTPFRA